MNSTKVLHNSQNLNRNKTFTETELGLQNVKSFPSFPVENLPLATAA